MEEKIAERIKTLTKPYTKIEDTAIFKVTDPYPKSLIIVAVEPNVPFYLEGWIDLSDLVDDELIKLAEYTKIRSGGWKKFEELAYIGNQEEPAYHIIPLLGYYGLGATLTMPAAPGADRSFDYLFFAWEAF